MNKTQYVRECLLEHPLLIPKLLKNPAFDSKITKGIMYDMIPFRSSVEIECIKSLSRTLSPFEKNNTYLKRRYDIIDYSDDRNASKSMSEHRISIINYSQASGLYKVLFDMKKHCQLNEASGIHIHIDAHKIAKEKFLLTDRNLEKTRKFLESKLNYIDSIFGGYKGRYNDKGIGFESKSYWINIRYKNLGTIEFRTAPMTFEYSTIIKWIVECNKIVKELHKELKVSYK
jgi:hypothetical protein